MSRECYSELECKIIHDQIARRAKYRKEFLKQRTDPCKHSLESGFVFDPAIQKFISMKSTQFQTFNANSRSALYGIMTVLPMFIYGYIIWKDRTEREQAYRCGEIRYRDRLFKFQ